MMSLTWQTSKKAGKETFPAVLCYTLDNGHAQMTVKSLAKQQK
jgi:hypothetical protein